jgi:hypothetical protein
MGPQFIFAKFDLTQTTAGSLTAEWKTQRLQRVKLFIRPLTGKGT